MPNKIYNVKQAAKIGLTEKDTENDWWVNILYLDLK